MKLFHWMAAATVASVGVAQAEVPELLELVPEAQGYELIAKFNPREYNSKGYQINRSGGISGKFKRLGYLVKLTDRAGKMTWIFTAMDPFTANVGETVVPDPGSFSFQTYVDNLEVASNVEGVKNGKFEKGNVEIWGNSYGGFNAGNIPGAGNACDFGDSMSRDGSYGSFQVHNYLEKQTCFAFNKFNAGGSCDLGIGNAPGQHPDWTFTGSGNQYKDAAIYVVGKFDDFQVRGFVELDGNRAALVGRTDKPPLTYAPGETMTFTLQADYQGQKPDGEYFIRWRRTGDDRQTASGQEKVSDQPLVIRTSLDKPGFVRIYATLVDKFGKSVNRRTPAGGREALFFDGGAAVQPEKLTGTPEPADFDAFWTKQKARLAAVPVKYEMRKLPQSNAKVDVYAVKIDCAGPQSVTGYLTVPVGAKDKSLPITVHYAGYGYNPQRDKAPNGGPVDRISLCINAHGYKLNGDRAYYQKFGETIRSNGKDYAFDPIQNSDPEKAYFNGMALRVMRSLEFVKVLPQWNNKELVVQGGSQGGLQAIWAAGLDPDVTAARFGFPWCCDLGGEKNFRRISGDWRIEYVKALDYYDPINFAKRIKCPVDITRVGLGDYVCPPSGVTVFYNNLKVPTTIRYYQGSTHGYVPDTPEIFVRQK